MTDTPPPHIDDIAGLVLKHNGRITIDAPSCERPGCDCDRTNWLVFDAQWDTLGKGATIDEAVAEALRGEG